MNLCDAKDCRVLKSGITNSILRQIDKLSCPLETVLCFKQYDNQRLQDDDTFFTQKVINSSSTLINRYYKVL